MSRCRYGWINDISHLKGSLQNPREIHQDPEGWTPLHEARHPGQGPGMAWHGAEKNDGGL